MRVRTPLKWDATAFARVLDTLKRDSILRAPRDLSDDVVFTDKHLAEIRTAMPREDATDEKSSRLLNGVSLDRVVIESHLDLSDVVLKGPVDLSLARLRGGATFENARFPADANFRGAEFGGATSFRGASFGARADFTGATFMGGATFAGVDMRPNFSEARFPIPDCAFDGATLRDAGFQNASFCCVSFRKAKFVGTADFSGLSIRFPDEQEMQAYLLLDEPNMTSDEVVKASDESFKGLEEALPDVRLAMDECRFAGDVRLTDVTSVGWLSLDRMTVDGRLILGCAAPVVFLRETQVERRAEIKPTSGDLVMDSAILRAPSLLAGARSTATSDAASVAHRSRNGSESRPPRRPRLLSLREASCSDLALNEVDLSACRFAGADGLERLRIADTCTFASTPPSRWYTRRRTLAEEHDWRWRADRGRGWLSPDVKPLELEDEPRPDPLKASEIASLYRSLRASLENSKNEPGAADFYYGEMEMRRRSDTAPLAERSILWLYWLVSGYGLRASRAVLGLVLTIAVLGAIPLALWGFHPDRSYGRALLFSLESSISLLRAPEAKLTAGGEVIQVLLRLAGPLFFGLALLALRGRVKR